MKCAAIPVLREQLIAWQRRRRAQIARKQKPQVVGHFVVCEDGITRLSLPSTVHCTRHPLP